MDVLRHAGEFMAVWGSQLVTLVLVLITGWYAFLTKRLADSSERAAQYAKESAEASRIAAHAARASIKIAFHVSPIYSSRRTPRGPDEVEDWFSGVSLFATHASVYVHGLRLYSAGEREGGSVCENVVDEIVTDYDVDLVLVMEEGHARSDLPVLAHADQRLVFELDQKALRVVGDIEDVSSMVCLVTYSLDGRGPAHSVTAEYWADSR